MSDSSDFYFGFHHSNVQPEKSGRVQAVSSLVFAGIIKFVVCIQKILRYILVGTFLFKPQP